MKKLLLLIVLGLTGVQTANAQNDTLLYENFNVDPTATYLTTPLGSDTVWVSYDADMLTEAQARPGNWYWQAAGAATADSTGAIWSSSWFSPAGVAQNFLITPPIPIVDATAVLHWSSAPYQTPLYLDGYKVLVSTTSNFPLDFTDTLFVAAEYLSGSSSNGGNYSAYTFSPGFVHGMDSTYIEFGTDSARFLGVLRPFSVSLAQYAGQLIYIAFLHDSDDDNLILLDDILVTGNLTIGIQENNINAHLTISPNPAVDRIELSYHLSSLAQVSVKIYDAKGSLVKEEVKGNLMAGEQKTFINVSDLAVGNYSLMLIAGNKFTRSSFVVAK